MIGLLVCLTLATQVPDDSAATAESLRFFESNVRPVLVEHCQSCHGAKKQWAGLRLDSREAILKGGDSGPALVPGQPDESLIIRAVRHSDENLKMPEDGKLSDRQIADLERWVKGGAVFPATGGAETSKKTGIRDANHWSFQPLARPQVPKVVHAEVTTTPVDRFVIARLEADGLAPAGRAQKEVLLRRVTFDLTGLPPAVSELEQFAADDRPDAYDRLVDRLLASPAYGERWGRHWLDVARYADSNGLDENVAHGNAWRYRDYVVAAFNRDRPFDRLIVEQLAGDLLPAANQEQLHELLTATGFISIGPKVLAEVNQAKMQMDIVDEQIDTVGRVFLGMTFGCARCHDHKFDPIDSTDYYGMAGIFKSTRTMDTYTKVAKWHENLLPSQTASEMQAAYDRQLAETKQAVEAYVAQADKQVQDKLTPDMPKPEKLEDLYPEAAKAELAKLREAVAALEKNPPDLPAAMGVTEDKIVDVAVHVRGNPLKLGDIVPRRTPEVMRGPPKPQFSSSHSGRRELADWLIDPEHPLTSRVFVNRVWRWHFGRGLVPSIDNFGVLGERPSHPELLDWLARRFVRDGWSLKSLHRLLLNSHTFQQDSIPAPEVAARDPENRLLGRMSVRRLDAEEIRDSLLAVSGQLDATFGGSMLKVKNRAYFFDHTSIDLTDYTSRRRSLYLPVVRNNVYDVFQLLDFPDPAVPSGDRATTTVAPQALFMLNSDLVMQSADELGRILHDATGDDAHRVARLYQVAYGRNASTSEIEANVAFVQRLRDSLSSVVPDETQRQQQAWSVLCHSILASNEFLYLR